MGASTARRLPGAHHRITRLLFRLSVLWWSDHGRVAQVQFVGTTARGRANAGAYRSVDADRCLETTCRHHEQGRFTAARRQPSTRLFAFAADATRLLAHEGSFLPGRPAKVRA